jgi:hypothetical protein
MFYTSGFQLVADRFGSATVSRGIRGCISVTVTVKITCLLSKVINIMLEVIEQLL